LRIKKLSPRLTVVFAAIWPDNGDDGVTLWHLAGSWEDDLRRLAASAHD
jgi:hypothetical protein